MIVMGHGVESYHEAESLCNEFYGGHLIQPTSYEQTNEIMTVLGSSWKHSLWLGVDLAEKKLLEFTNWEQNIANFSLKCPYMIKAAKGKWSMGHCKQKLEYACQKVIPRHTERLEWLTGVVNGKEYAQLNPDVALDWIEANFTCQNVICNRFLNFLQKNTLGL